jgi:hypothetical protein
MIRRPLSSASASATGLERDGVSLSREKQKNRTERIISRHQKRTKYDGSAATSCMDPVNVSINNPAEEPFIAEMCFSLPRDA